MTLPQKYLKYLVCFFISSTLLSTSALGGQYALDTDMVNNLYFMQDGVANSVPAGTYPTYTWLNQYYRTVGVSGVNDAATVIAQDTTGTYNAAGEARINR